MFSPRPDYHVRPRPTQIKDFHDYADAYVVRPPYQRKNVWATKKQQALLDSLVRGYYVPRIVIREVRTGTQELRKEVIDGQQRIHTVQLFFSDQLSLPDSLKDVHSGLPGSKYSALPVEIREFIDKEIVFDVDIVGGIEDPHDPEHQKLAAQIFWRLQQGESLNFMEVAHSRLSSLVRNFVVKYADDITFDFGAYKPVDENPHKHPFFNLYDRANDRMQHLMLMTRLLMCEFVDGPAEIKDSQVSEFIDEWQVDDGIGSDRFEHEPQAKALISTLDEFVRVFKDDPLLKEGGRLKELRREHFIVSFVLLLRHLRKYYVVGPKEREAFRAFMIAFHARWVTTRSQDPDVLLFRDNRQQGKQNLETRHMVLRQLFFQHLADNGLTMKVKDEKRSFSEAERIAIYRRDEGLCQACLAEGKPEKEATVSWAEYEADHVLPHACGGQTVMENAQVLCSYHNKQKGARTREHT